MTLPDERTRAIIMARDFLLSLMIPKETPRVPKEIRKTARAILKHYPMLYETHLIARKSDLLDTKYTERRLNSESE